VFDKTMPTPRVAGYTVRLVNEDDDLGRISSVARVAFASPGTAAGTAGIEALDAKQREASAFERERLRSGRTITAAVFTEDGEPVVVGSHQPVGDVSEIVGIGTLPAFRRRGLAALVTKALVDDALQKVETVFLSAGDADVARVYERVGFQRIATACIAEP
jgi:GNAT superfamily N-acetyltransferase